MTPVRDAATLPPAKSSILIVEDEGLIAHDIESRLRKAGYSIAGIADSGEGALEKAAETDPSLVLMDIRLRGEMDGIETARQLRQRHGIPVVYLTAHTDHETIERAKVAGPYGYLAKPLSSASLTASVEVALHNHRMERQLEQQRSWLRTATLSMSDGMIVTDQLGWVQYMNPAAEELTGRSLHEALNSPVSRILPLVHPDPGFEFGHFFLSTLSDDQPRPLPAGIRLSPAANRQIPVEGAVSPCLERGRSFGSVITFRDTTERDNQERQHRLEQKMEAVGRMAAGVAHDFNNLMTVVVGQAELLRIGHNRTEEQVSRRVEEILKAGNSAATLARKLLSFSRQQNSAPRLVDLNALVRDEEDVFRRLLGETIEWRATLREDTKSVFVDPEQLLRVLMNLVLNGRDAMPENGTLTVTVENAAPAAAGGPAAGAGMDYVVISVADNGVGMDDSIAEHIFEPFFTTKPPDHGTGLGLSIVHALVKEMGGKISVETALGAGTTFRIILPAALESAPAVPTHQSVPASRSTPTAGNILLVDDNEAIRSLLAECLAHSGYQILQAAEGEQAITLAAAHRGTIDLLLTDVAMPKMNGVRLAEELIRVRPNLKVLFVSGCTDGVLNRVPDLPHKVSIMQKPVRLGELVSKVGQLIGDGMIRGIA